MSAPVHTAAAGLDLLPPAPFNRSGSSFLSTPIIYEVNLSIPKSKSADYYNYLRKFTQQVVTEVSGFSGAQVYTSPKPVGLHWLSEEGDAKDYVTVHYMIESEHFLQDYLAHQQERVATEKSEEWGFLVTSRRVLKQLHITK